MTVVEACRMFFDVAPSFDHFFFSLGQVKDAFL